jgi:adenylylsulfate kinase
MNTAAADERASFALWITGLPASGKSAVAAQLVRLFRERDIEPAVLESDALRRVFSEAPSYDDAGRQYFYTAVAFIAATLVSRGIPVIVDATANRRAYRDRARRTIARFAEVYVDCPLEVCMRRDPKGLYRHALDDPENRMPGLGAAYEPPEHPDIVIRGDAEPPEIAARHIMEMLSKKGFVRSAG